MVKHSFWILIFLIYLLVSSVSYNVLQNLYFWREDFASMYLLGRGELYHWPYQGVTIIDYPLFQFFANQPLGYAIVSIFFYAVLCLILAFFIWKLTKNKALAFCIGLLLSSGHVGSEALLFITYGPSSVFYMISVFILILLYQGYYKRRTWKKWLQIFTLYLILIFLVSYRAFNLLLILVLADIYFSVFKIQFLQIFRKDYLIKLSKTFSPFVLVTLLAYIILPHLLGWYGVKNTTYYLNFSSQKLSLESQMNFLKDIGNFLVPSSLQTEIATILPSLILGQEVEILVGSGIGFLVIIFSFWYIFFSKTEILLKRTFLFFFSAFLATYAFYHLSEYDLTHPSWHRYFFYSYPFFAASLGIVLYSVFFRSKKQITKGLGVLCLVLVILLNLNAARNSDFIKMAKSRSVQTKEFIVMLKSYVPEISGKTLFYFDVASDPKTQAEFNVIFASGIFPTETALAFLYHRNVDDIKIIDYYDDFLREYKSGNFNNTYVFFYNKDRKLINLSSCLQANSPSQVATIQPIKTQQNFLEYKTTVQKHGTSLMGINDRLVINVDYSLCLKPIKVNIKMKAGKLLDSIDEFLFTGVKPPEDMQKINSEDETARKDLANYLLERSEFKNQVKIKSNGYENPGRDNYLIDGDLKTSWIANKKMWERGKKPWIEIEFSNRYSFSEIRWISTYTTRLPLSYDYQIYNDNTKDWKTIYQKRSLQIDKDKYVVDKFPVSSTKKFRMIILESSGDFPAISELEILKNQHQIDSMVADFTLDYPLYEIKNKADMERMTDIVQNFLSLKVLPISDKYLNSFNSIASGMNLILDSQSHTYSFVIQPGGTFLKSIILEFPNIPLQAFIESVSIETELVI